ncbi:MAG: hypothetical protein QG657_3873 [Acidobacteriota bacterium]|nr:hypothetical protein [Acidobacteriota bacterium]
MSSNENNIHRTGLEIAVIGMALRFPDAANIHEFWHNLVNGKESVSIIPDEQLEKLGIKASQLNNPNYVKTKTYPKNKEYFDASFFGFTPQEAEFMHPQTRLFFECTWEALEDAGYDPETYEGSIGLYAGGTTSFFWEALFHLREKHRDEVGNNLSMHLYEKDFMCSQIAYNLNLKGACASVHTACSTSLVSIYLACRALLMGESDMVLAGGACIDASPQCGYLYQEGMILSPDGHCRTFDAKSKGTIPGNGVGIVLLKRLKTALADRDHIYAIIKGAAIDNDGRRKVGYRAPSIEGQADAIRAAQRMARVEPESISYIETHGTGTILGDPVEMAGLKLAFPATKKKFCAIGSVKTNIGHLDTAAGVAGFIKTVLALKHRLIPPSLNFESPNPKLDLDNSPFYVNTIPKKWENHGFPLRAGVSSFGAGGTNAHVILEEAPQPVQSPENKHWKLLLFSTKTSSALDKMTTHFAAFLKQNPGINLSDAAYTLQIGRGAFQYRKMLVCADCVDAIEVLSSADSRKVKTGMAKNTTPAIVFMFPGLGAQYVNMGLELFRGEPVFQEAINRCFEILKPLGYDLNEILYPSFEEDNRVNNSYKPNINQFDIAQLVVFTIEYSLAKLLIAWGITPYAMIGYSFGEYAAACISGVISLEDALKLITTRGKLIEQTPPGAMLSIPLPINQVTPLLNNRLSIAIDNGDSTVLSGAVEDIAVFERDMQTRKLVCVRLKGAYALHSTLMKPISTEFTATVEQVTLKQPGIPYISNVTGDWLTPAEALNPAYWSTHLLETVHFAGGVKKLLDEPSALFVEIGPGRDLCSLVKRYFPGESAPKTYNMIRTPQENAGDIYYLLNRVGQLWLQGVKIDWRHFHKDEKRFHIPLPTYPFEGQYYWYEENVFAKGADKILDDNRIHKQPDMADWFYVPSWTRSVLPQTTAALDSPTAPGAKETPSSSYQLVFSHENHFASELDQRLRQNNPHIITVRKGFSFNKIDNREYIINPRQSSDYDELFSNLRSQGQLPRQILHLWCITGANADQEEPASDFEKLQDIGFYSLLYLAKSIGKQKLVADIRIEVVSDNIQKVTGGETICPGKATVLGPVKVIPQEYPYIICRSIDIEMPEPGDPHEEMLIRQLIEEFAADPADTAIAYRNNYRWVQAFQPVRLSPPQGTPTPPLRPGGVYLITGGLGNIGFSLARYLVESSRAKLILIGRTAIPPEEEWNSVKEENLKDKIEKLRQLKTMGAEMLIFSVDVAHKESMQAVVNKAEKKLGPVNGVIHAAGRVDAELFQAIAAISREKCSAHFLPKVCGIQVLKEIFQGKELDFCLLVSSLSPILGGLGFVAYAAANLFLDAFVHQFNRENPQGQGWLCVNWADWQFGEITNAGSALGASAIELSITPGQGIATFQRILNNYHLQQIIVSAGRLQDRIDQWVKLKSLRQEDDTTVKQSSPIVARPDLLSPYVPSRDPLEKSLADIWQGFFGLDRIGIQDNFFELGGDSLKAITVIAKVHKKLNITIPLAEFFNRPTIEKLADFLRNDDNQSLALPVNEENLVLLKKGADNADHFFFIHDGTGDADVYIDLCNQVNTGINYWGIRADRLQNYTPCDFDIEQGAAKYIEKIKKIQPNGPYSLGGWSFGGIVAFEVVRQLENMHESIKHFALIDPVTPPQASQGEYRPFTVESELRYLAYFLQGVADEISKKIHEGKITGLKQFWPVVLEYLGDIHFDIETIKSAIPGTIMRAIANFDRSDIGKLIYYTNAIRSFSQSLDYYSPKNKIQTPIHYFGASESRESEEFNREGWNGYSSQPIVFYEIPGDHFTILKLPEVAGLAKVFA